MTYTENVRLAMQSIKSNRLRTFLTALIIAIGISALVGILTTINAIEKKMTEAFSSMGANSFTIRNRGTGIRVGGPGQRPKTYKPMVMCFGNRMLAYCFQRFMNCLSVWLPAVNRRGHLSN